MKKLLLLPLLLLIACSGKSQQRSGVITYERKLSFSKEELKNSNLPDGFAAMIMEGKKTQKMLYFTSDASLCENNTNLPEKESEYTDGNMMIQAAGSEPDEKVFVDLKNKRKTEQKDLMGKLFLIKDEPLQAVKWKATGRQKKILGHACMEAVSVEKDSEGKETKITAWYTTAIPVATGPEGITGLPGMVLEVSFGSNISYTAVKINAIDAKAIEHIRPPVKGKRTTAKEFEALSLQKMRAMEQQMESGGTFMIKREK